MCGIVGVVAADPTSRSEAIVTRMADALAHRGPDDAGLVCGNGATIAARRLSIIDLARGHQPMSNERGDVWAVQNGEIYNFRELREELVASGHRFRTDNDTEVIPHAYEEWGEDLVTKLRGMFALALWDETRQRLLLARDRFGKKPLAYAQVGETLLFASEIQALLRHPAISRDVDAGAIGVYLSLGYVPAPRTGFSAIRKLAPAHVAVFEAGRLSARRYWTLSFEPKLPISFDEAVEEVGRLIDEAVRVRLVSDVPLGAFLSGGLDSSTVVAYMARNSSRPVRTFSIGFAERGLDELPYARAVARAFGTVHEELVVEADHAEHLPMLARHLGEPFADSSIVPTYQVARITRAHVTVALTGDGGDELFGGYDRYRAAAIAELARRLIPGPLLRGAAAFARGIPGGARFPRSATRALRLLSQLGSEPSDQYLGWVGYFSGAEGAEIKGPLLRGVTADMRTTFADAVAESGARRVEDAFMAADALAYLPYDLLVKMDTATMAASLESRAPLLDQKLAEFVARLPVEYKVRPGSGKALLRRLMRDRLPEAVVRRGKRGFAAPVASWLRGPLRPMLEDLVLSDRAAARGFVDRDAASSLVREHLSGVDRAGQLWDLLMLELWLTELVDRVPAREIRSTAASVGVGQAPVDPPSASG